MNRVFNSVNGSTIKPDNGKSLRCAVTTTSQYLQFWQEAIEVFESMKFVDIRQNKASRPPCIRNWIITLKCIIYLWNKLKLEGFKFLLDRNINQNPLEYTFGKIRSHGIRNTNPSSLQFVASFKTLLINNFSFINTIGNCMRYWII